jgi:hypothetical protein
MWAGGSGSGSIDTGTESSELLRDETILFDECFVGFVAPILNNQRLFIMDVYEYL